MLLKVEEHRQVLTDQKDTAAEIFKLSVYVNKDSSVIDLELQWPRQYVFLTMRLHPSLLS